MNFIIGTAGHVDHGKTSIIKCLTGKDTDQLEEEKKRGLTIVPGFASINTDSSDTISFIDCPGHEKFINNMVKGTYGIDLIMLIVAADDGIMPQTMEHMAVASFLGLTKVIPVITKIDRAEKPKICALKDELLSIFKNNKFSSSEFFYTSAVTLEGIEKLENYLRQIIFPARYNIDNEIFRMPIDRAFKITGSGMIITGSVVSGALFCDEFINISSKNDEFRVRHIECHGDSVKTVSKGNRAGINLSFKKNEYKLNNLYCYSGIKKRNIKAAIAVFYDSEFDKIYRGEYTFLSGTSVSSVRIYGLSELKESCDLTPDKQKIFKKRKMLVRLSFNEPFFIHWSDRFLIRDTGSKKTIGGGVILFPEHSDLICQKKLSLFFSDFKLVSKSENVYSKSILFSCSLLLNLILKGVADFDLIEATFPLKEKFIETILKKSTKFVFQFAGSGKIRKVMLVKKFLKIFLDMISALKYLHDSSLNKDYFSAYEIFETLNQSAQKNNRDFYYYIEEIEFVLMIVSEKSLLSKNKFNNKLIYLVEKNKIVYTHGSWKLSGYSIKLNDKNLKLKKFILEFMNRNKFRPLGKSYLLNCDISYSLKNINQVIDNLKNENKIIILNNEMFMNKESFIEILNFLKKHFERTSEIDISVFKNFFSNGRKSAIIILEYCDIKNYTVRQENSRIKGPMLDKYTGD
jgi:selenocysteine-specific elongation factor